MIRRKHEFWILENVVHVGVQKHEPHLIYSPANPQQSEICELQQKAGGNRLALLLDLDDGGGGGGGASADAGSRIKMANTMTVIVSMMMMIA